jgi:acyl-CoA thioesterase-1
MKNRNLAILLASVAVCLAASTVQAQKIMPFGDSVTANGSAPESSYRYWLWQKLQTAGFTGVTFIGANFGVGDGSPANSDFDQSYEGGDGWSSSDALGDAPAAANRDGGPDIVLLDFGSNDIIEGMSLTDTQSNLEQIIDDFAAVNPNVIILIAQPTPFVTPVGSQRSQQSKLCGIISKVAKAENQAGVRVIKVNLFGGFSARGDTKDGTHPNVRGEQKIANKFFKALKKVL